ncbi:MAG: ATP-dependent helicase [Ignavibacteriales bacterium]|nr:ATP-dependent helicase [Ignavibacteriales bacterium]
MTAFGLTPAAIQQWLDTRAGNVSAIFRLSSCEAPIGSVPPNSVIIQDVSFPELKNRLPLLVGQMLYPLWLHGTPFHFLSILHRDDYRPAKISSEAVHGPSIELERYFLCEQLLALLTLPPPSYFIRTTDAASSDLDASQRLAVNHLHGPICVLAPAGSGKTRTLIRRIVHMTNSGISREEILALAYNTKAADEMKNRLLSHGITGIAVRTFHSLGFEICRNAGWHFDPENSQSQTQQLLGDALLGGCGIGTDSLTECIPVLLKAIERAKSELILPPLRVPGKEGTISFEKFFHNYCRLHRQQRRLAFDDMVYVALRIMIDDDSVRRAYQDRFHYILADEFQDLNAAQMQMLRILALPRNHLFAVGDDDQMIYGWRGASVRYLIAFAEMYPSAQQIVLQTNYRSSRDVVRHSRRLIEYNAHRIAKDIRPREGAELGSFSVERAASLHAQAASAIAWMKTVLTHEHLEWRDFAFLFRTNVLQFPIALELDCAGIPHSPLRFDLLFHTPAGRLLLGTIRVLQTKDTDDTCEFRFLLKELRLSRKSIERFRSWHDLEESASLNNLPVWEDARLRRARAGLRRLRTLAVLPDASTLTILHALNDLFEISSRCRTRRRQEPDEPGDADVFEVLCALSCKYPLFREFCIAVDGWTTPHEDGKRDNCRAESRNKVTLSTIHRTKGNEYRNVIYYNMVIPSESTGESLEEERRVAYVGLTRAKDHVLITAPDRCRPPFLREAALDPAFARTRSMTLRLRWFATWLLGGTGISRSRNAERCAGLARELTLRRKVR